MKKTCLIALTCLLLNHPGYGQSALRNCYVRYNEIKLEDFVNENLTCIEEYKFNSKSGRKLLKDSVLVYRKTYDPNTRTIKGILLVGKISGNKKQKYVPNRYFNESWHYDAKGLLLDKTESHRADKKGRSRAYRLDVTRIEYTYNDSGKVLFEKYTRVLRGIRFSKKDSLIDILQTDTSLRQHVYDAGGRKIAIYKLGGREKELEESWQYNGLQLLYSHKKYSSKWVVSESTYYLYDARRRLVKVIDSNALDLLKRGDCFVLIKSFHYEKDSFTGYSEEYLDFRIREGFYYSRINEFNSLGHPVYFSSKMTPGSPLFEIRYENIYDGGRLVLARVIRAKKSYELQYKYSEKGYILEERAVYKGKVRRVFRYYYR